MSTFRLFAFAKEIRIYSAPALSMALLFGVLTGCGGSVKQNIAPPSTTIAFSSSGALDGSNVSISAQNIWFSKADGSGATPITKLRNDSVGVDDLVWSPDGTKLAFISSRALLKPLKALVRNPG